MFGAFVTSLSAPELFSVLGAPGRFGVGFPVIWAMIGQCVLVVLSSPLVLCFRKVFQTYSLFSPLKIKSPPCPFLAPLTLLALNISLMLILLYLLSLGNHFPGIVVILIFYYYFLNPCMIYF